VDGNRLFGVQGFAPVDARCWVHGPHGAFVQHNRHHRQRLKLIVIFNILLFFRCNRGTFASGNA
jgi:hypothetical protein